MMSRESNPHTIVERIQGIRRPHPVRVGFDGIDAAGKTTLADKVARGLAGSGRQVIRASLDGFHNPREVRYRRGKLSPEGYYHDSFNYDSLMRNLLGPLSPGGDRRFRTVTFDFQQDKPVDQAITIAHPQAILIFDGIFLQRPAIKPYWDLCIFIHVSFETALKRALQRDLVLLGSADEVRRRYQRRYFPAQKIYLDQCQPIESADILSENETTVEPLIVHQM
jgi:uridine kinase